MASKHFVVLLLLFLGATITRANLPVTYPIRNISDPKFQSLGSFAVEEYDKRGESHLFFKEVFGGYKFFYPGSGGLTYYLDLMAINCSHSGALGNYTAQVVVVSWNHTTSHYFQALKPKQT